MAEFRHQYAGFPYKPGGFDDPHHRPYWARSQVKYAQDLLDYTTDPIEYEHDDKDYWDNHFFFPEDCSWSPPKDWDLDDDNSEEDFAVGECYDHSDSDIMIPGLPDIKMLDAEALSDLLEDNLSPPEITSIFVFATNGAIFAYASSLPSRQLRNLSATYGAAYTCYAKNASSGNLTGVNPASNPSSYVTAQSVSLGDVGSIVFELDDSVAVVTRIADKVLLAAVGPSKTASAVATPADTSLANSNTASSASSTTGLHTDAASTTSTSTATPTALPHTNGATSNPTSTSTTPAATPGAGAGSGGYMTQAQLESQYEVDRSRDLERLASLNLSTPPSILLALESKSAALGRFLGQKLEDLQSPEDF